MEYENIKETALHQNVGVAESGRKRPGQKPILASK
jgi:hypothetical protein